MYILARQCFLQCIRHILLPGKLFLGKSKDIDSEELEIVVVLTKCSTDPSLQIAIGVRQKFTPRKRPNLTASSSLPQFQIMWNWLLERKTIYPRIRFFQNSPFSMRSLHEKMKTKTELSVYTSLFLFFDSWMKFTIDSVHHVKFVENKTSSLYFILDF